MENAIGEWIEWGSEYAVSDILKNEFNIAGEGHIRIRWSRSTLQMFIEIIKMRDGSPAMVHLSNICKSLLHKYKTEINSIMLESVPNNDVSVHLQLNHDWKPGVCGNSLTLYAS